MQSQWSASVSGLRIERGGASVASVAGFASGWLLMVFAMMLPTTPVLVAAFHERTAGRARGPAPQVVLLGAYVGVWTLAGVALQLVALAGRAAVGSRATLAGALVVAGAYELGPLKPHLLARCRAPATTLGRFGKDASAWGLATRAGTAHGVACVGSSWALMLVMLGRGDGCSLLWMEALTAVMVVERLTLNGHRARTAMGCALVIAAAAVLAT
jgi:predicted metal-binding membrane protein